MPWPEAIIRAATLCLLSVFVIGQLIVLIKTSHPRLRNVRKATSVSKHTGLRRHASMRAAAHNTNDYTDPDFKVALPILSCFSNGFRFSTVPHFALALGKFVFSYLVNELDTNIFSSSMPQYGFYVCFKDRIHSLGEKSAMKTNFKYREICL